MHHCHYVACRVKCSALFFYVKKHNAIYMYVNVVIITIVVFFFNVEYLFMSFFFLWCFFLFVLLYHYLYPLIRFFFFIIFFSSLIHWHSLLSVFYISSVFFRSSLVLLVNATMPVFLSTIIQQTSHRWSTGRTFVAFLPERLHSLLPSFPTHRI